MEKICSFGRRLFDWLRNGFVPSKTVFFIWGLSSSHVFVKYGVVKVLMDFLRWEKYGLREAVVIVNSLDGVSAILKVAVTHVSEAYTGCLWVIIFCTAAYVMGLMLLWVCALTRGTLILALVLIALGQPGNDLIGYFLENQLSEKVKETCAQEKKKEGEEKESLEEKERSNENHPTTKFRRTTAFVFRSRSKKKEGEEKESLEGKERSNENHPTTKFRRTTAFVFRTRSKKKEGEDKESLEEKERSNENHTGTKYHEGEDKESFEGKERSNENRTGNTNLWWTTASIFGSVAVLPLGSTSWLETFRISFFVMGAMYILFVTGIICYYPEKRPTESPLTTIYMVFKAAIKKRSLPYPCSEDGDYSNNKNQGPDDSKDRFYWSKNGEVHLEPRDPSFWLFLDKAAVIRNNSDAEREERNGEVCTVEQVRHVKSLYPFVLLGFTFLAYSLVSASGNTYFIEQGSNLDPRVGNFNVPSEAFFVLQSLIAVVVRKIQSRKKVDPIWSIGIGMFCSVPCCVAAWQVEYHRLSLIIRERVLESEEPDEVTIPLSIMVLTPQYVLLGLMEGFAEDGLKTFVSDQVPESMRKFVDPCIEMLLGIGKFSSILCALIFHSWFGESINTSHVDRYFLLLASLSFVFFWIYVCYAKCKLSLPQSEGPETNEETDPDPMIVSSENDIV